MLEPEANRNVKFMDVFSAETKDPKLTQHILKIFDVKVCSKSVTHLSTQLHACCVFDVVFILFFFRSTRQISYRKSFANTVINLCCPGAT